MHRYTQIITLVFLLGCSSESNNQVSEFEGTEQVIENDSTQIRTFRNKYDLSLIDSVYLYEYRTELDSFILTNQTIYSHNDLQVLVSATEITITLQEPKNAYYAVVLEQPIDTIIWGPNEAKLTGGVNFKKARSMTIPNFNERLIKGAFQDWGIESHGDSVGSIGYQISRMLTFTITE